MNYACLVLIPTQPASYFVSLVTDGVFAMFFLANMDHQWFFHDFYGFHVESNEVFPSQFSGEDSNSTTSMSGFSSRKVRDFALTLVPPVLVAIWESWIYILLGVVTRQFLDPWSLIA